MKTLVWSFLILSLFSVSFAAGSARAGTLLCGAANKDVVFRVSFATGNPGSVQIMAAYTRIKLMNKADMKGNHYWGRGHSPKILGVDVGSKLVSVRARGGMMGPGGTLKLPTDVLYGRARDIADVISASNSSAAGPSYYSKALKREFPLACKLYD